MISKLLLLSFLLLLLYVNCDDTLEANEIKRWCIVHKKKYNLVIGENWGSMPSNIQDEWINKTCDKHFCQFHPKFGKGVFKCEDLLAKENHTLVG